MSPEVQTFRSHHNGQEAHAVHPCLVDVDPGDVQDGRAEVDVRHQHLSHVDSLVSRHSPFNSIVEEIISLPDWSGLL